MKKFFSSCFLMIFLTTASHGLTLSASIDLALKQNPSVIASRKKVEAAGAKLRQATCAFLPTVKLEGAYGKSYTQPSVIELTTTAGTQKLTFGTDASYYTKNLSTSLSQPLFVAPLVPGYKIARMGLELAEEDLKKASFEISFQVTQAYFEAIKAEKFVQLSEESRQMARSHLRQVKSLTAAGSAGRTELLRAEVQLANAELALTRAVNALEIAKNTFNNAIGAELEQEVNLIEDFQPGPIPSPPDYNNLIGIAFQHRPEWKQYVLNKKIAEESVNIARTGYLPAVMINAQTTNRITDYPSYKTDVNSWSVLGVASWTLFDGFGVQNRIREAEALLDVQKAAEDQIKNGIKLEVKNAWSGLKTGAEAITAAKKAKEASEENLRLLNSLYNIGSKSDSEVLDAQVALTQSSLNYFQALFDLETAKSKINKVVGEVIFK